MPPRAPRPRYSEVRWCNEDDLFKGSCWNVCGNVAPHDSQFEIISWLLTSHMTVLFYFSLEFCTGLKLEGSLQEHKGDSPSHQGYAPSQVHDGFIITLLFRILPNYSTGSDYWFPHHICMYVISRATKYLKNVITQKEIIPFRWAFSQFNLPLILPLHICCAPSHRRFNQHVNVSGVSWEVLDATPRPTRSMEPPRAGQKFAQSVSYYFGEFICLATRWWSQPCTTRDKQCRVLPL